MDRMNDKLDALWAEYREACPDPEPSANFMPQMWRRIEERRTASGSVFRRLAQVCVVATAALAVVLGVVVIPHVQGLTAPFTTYADVLAENHVNTYVDVLMGDIK